MTPRTLTHLTVFALVLVLGYAAQAGVAGLEPHQQLARDILRELTEINTTDSVGDNTAAANAMAQRLLQAGFTEEAVSIIEASSEEGQSRSSLPGHRRPAADSSAGSPRCRRSPPGGLVVRPLRLP